MFVQAPNITYSIFDEDKIIAANTNVFTLLYNSQNHQNAFLILETKTDTDIQLTAFELKANTSDIIDVQVLRFEDQNYTDKNNLKKIFDELNIITGQAISKSVALSDTSLASNIFNHISSSSIPNALEPALAIFNQIESIRQENIQYTLDDLKLQANINLPPQPFCNIS